MSHKFTGLSKSAPLAVAVAGELVPRTRRDAVPKTRESMPAAMQARIGMGRPKGAQNKFTKEVKEVIAKCFDDIGGAAAFAEWARHNRKDFYKLYSKLLPIQMQNAPNGNSITIYISPTEADL